MVCRLRLGVRRRLVKCQAASARGKEVLSVRYQKGTVQLLATLWNRVCASADLHQSCRLRLGAASHCDSRRKAASGQRCRELFRPRFLLRTFQANEDKTFACLDCEFVGPSLTWFNGEAQLQGVLLNLINPFER